MKKISKALTRKAGNIILIIMVAIVLLVVLTVTAGKFTMQSGKKVETLEEGWYYIRDGKRVSVKLPVTIISEDGGPFTICNDSLGEEDAGKMVTTKGAQYNLEIALDDRVLYAYDDSLFPRNTQMKAKQECDAVLPANIADGTLTLTCREPLHQAYQFSEVRIGYGNDIFQYHLDEALPMLMVAFLFTILGVIAILIAIYLHYRAIDSRRFVDTALFLLICSVWFVTDSSIVQRYGGPAPLICIISFYAFMLLAVPMLHFVKNIENMRKYRVIDLLIFLFYANAVIQGILNVCVGIEFVDMLFVTHILLAAGVFVTVFLMLRESRHSKDRDVLMVLTAFVALTASGVLALILYWLLEIPFYGNIFQAGILIFVALILANVIIVMAESIQYRTKMLAYQQLAKKDWLTGLGNRLAFEELLTGLENDKTEYKKAGLIFLDVNHLKQVNDESGHAAGDEIIIGAAECIVNVFQTEESSFRIGGDEFGVILTDPQTTEEEYFRCLDEEIEQYNREHSYHLSLARGWSSLYGEDGQRKTISDWKYEADCRMYENKNGTMHS